PTYDHGVAYNSSTVSLSAPLDIRYLEKKGITFVRVQWVDLTNVVRVRVVPVAYFKKVLDSPRPGFAMTKATMGLVYLNLAEGFSAMGEYLYMPDLSTLRLCPYAPGQASVLGKFQEKTPYLEEDGLASVDVALCPRGILRRVIERASLFNLELLVGIETEFILLKSTDPIEAVSYHDWTSTAGLLSGAVETTVMQEIAETLITSGVELQMYHPEAAPGQYEVVTGPLPPFKAADIVIHVRETIMNIAAKHGLKATFAPRVYMDSTGSSAHTHISVNTPGERKEAGSLTKSESHFLAGVLYHLPALPSITLPIPASYKRVADGCWTGGTHVCWGTENREAPIRLVNATAPTSRRFEMRFVDGTANPHLALAAILAAGLDGVKNKLPLNIRDCPGPVSAAQMSEEERHALGIWKRLPLSWEEARSNFRQDEILRDFFGREFVEKYLSVNKTLAESLAADQDEEKALSRLVKFY
ncbi:hypothetical protein M422DRAFT_34638, partial [Sphaerobolus stellatus SS14]